MSIVELIGFVISLISILFLFLMKKQRVDDSANQPEEFRGEKLEEEDPLKELLRQVNTPKQKVTPKPSVQRHPPSKPNASWKASPHLSQQVPSFKDDRFKSAAQERKIKSELEQHSIKSKLAEKKEGNAYSQEPNHFAQPRIVHFVERLSKKSDMIVYQEILDKPKSLR